MTSMEIVKQLNAHRPQFLSLLSGEVLEVDALSKTCTMGFEVSTDFCHSVNVVQGGFVTTMLDATMTHTAFACAEPVLNVATMEIKVSFLEPALAGNFRAVGHLIKEGRSTGFMEGKLYDGEGKLIATATTTVKLVRPR
jgi:uncharacterized protein (TIGR00369 family)